MLVIELVSLVRPVRDQSDILRPSATSQLPLTVAGPIVCPLQERGGQSGRTHKLEEEANGHVGLCGIPGWKCILGDHVHVRPLP